MSYRLTTPQQNFADMGVVAALLRVSRTLAYSDTLRSRLPLAPCAHPHLDKICLPMRGWSLRCFA